MSQDFYPVSAVIPANEAVSAPVDLGGSRVVALQMPALWTAANITLLVSRCPDIANLFDERAADILADADAFFWTRLIGTETLAAASQSARAVVTQKCISVVTPGGVVNEGVVSPPVWVHRSVSYTGSFYIRQTGATGGTVECALAWYTIADAFISETAVPVVTTLSSSAWQRAVVTETAPATAAYARLRIRTQSAPAAAQAITFYVDAVQLEQAAAASTYLPLADQQGQGGGTWGIASDMAGNQFVIVAPLVNEFIVLGPATTAGFRYIRLKASAAQAAERTVTLITRPT